MSHPDGIATGNPLPSSVATPVDSVRTPSGAGWWSTRGPTSRFRRHAIAAKALGAALLVLLAVGPTTPLPAQARRPSVLVIVSDDLAAHALGCYGNPHCLSPRLDRLAAAGMRFERAFCNSPVCTASRQSLLTGRYPRSLGVTKLGTPLPESAVTLADRFAAAGYLTAALGKMHFNSQLQHGFQTRVDLADHRGFLAGHPGEPLPAELATLGPWKPFRDPARIWLNSQVLPYALREPEMASSYLVDEAAKWLTAAGEAPFLLFVSFYEPHSPFHFPIEYAGRVSPEQFAVPPVSGSDQRQIPEVFAELTDAEKRGIAAAYHTSVAFLDASVGRLLDSLERAGRQDDTLIVFLGDHGYLLGHHGRFEKHCSWEEAIRVPLLVAAPGRVEPGGVSSALVELVDVAPTVLEWAGLPLTDDLAGESLWLLLERRATEHRPRVVVEYAPNEEALIRDQRWKLIYRLGQVARTDGYATLRPPAGVEIELYDLETDPHETTNLAQLPEHQPRVAELLGHLVDHLRQTARRPLPVGPQASPAEELKAALVSDDVEP